MVAILILALAGGRLYVSYVKGSILRRELDAARAELRIVTARNDALKDQLENIKKLMSVSFDGKRMLRPLHLRGDMMIVFKGEVD